MANPLTNLTNPNAITSDGSTVDATAWTTDWSSVVNFINASLVASFNVFSAEGDIMVYDGTDIQALHIGTNGQFLTANSSAPYGLEWTTTATTTALTTNGDMLYYNSGLKRLPIGTTAQVLTVVGGLPVWAGAEFTFTPGMMMMWVGALNAIPSGWALMDGQSNAAGSGINMQGLFVAGAGATSPAASGGMGLMNIGGPYGDNSAGAGLGPSHTHSAGGVDLNIQTGPNGAAWNGASASTTTSGSGGAVTPKYYSVAFIEYLP